MTAYRQRRNGWSTGQVVFLLALTGVGLVLASQTLLQGDRRGTPRLDLAQEARAYLREKQVAPLSGELNDLLASASATAVATLPHPLVGKTAPDFQLNNHLGQPHSLSAHLAKGPVVLIFYYGYYCNHCVGQLFAVHDDIARFRELGAEVIAISADPPEQTAARFDKFGAFDYPALSDPANRVAAQYSVFFPANAEIPERLLHGTFVIDQQGVVRWCNYGDEPFTDNASLLFELAKATGRLAP